MAILEILKYPNNLLRQKTKIIEDSQSSEIQELIFDMLETMEDNGNALGLAAPQVGKSVRLCIAKLDGVTHILINPQIKSHSWIKGIAEEGCLSFPEKFIPIKRSKKVTIQALDRKGEKIIIKADGLLARALQHEIDHLEGILFIDKEVKTKK